VIELLAARGPDPRFEEKLMLYGQFVGSWTVESRELQASGDWLEQRGEWHFGWVLGGRGVQDVLFERDAPPNERGSTLRCYDEWLDAWHVTWMAPSWGEFAHQVGRQVEDRIVQEGSGRRWTFFDVEPDSFSWTGEAEAPGGWQVVQQMTAARIA
jgi:hypothetical protein